MRGWVQVACALCWAGSARASTGAGQEQQSSGTDVTLENEKAKTVVIDDDGKVKTDLRRKDADCVNCDRRHSISVDEHFNKLKTDPKLKEYVSPVLARLKQFKIPVHPRIGLFYELLKVGMSEHARRTALSLYVPDKYNNAHGRAPN